MNWRHIDLMVEENEQHSEISLHVGDNKEDHGWDGAARAGEEKNSLNHCNLPHHDKPVFEKDECTYNLDSNMLIHGGSGQHHSGNKGEGDRDRSDSCN